MPLKSCLSAGGWGEGWVVETLLSIPVSYPALHSTYSSLIQLKLPCWEQLGQPYHLHIAMSLLLTSYVQHLNSVPLAERKPLLSSIQVLIAFQDTDTPLIARYSSVRNLPTVSGHH